MRTTACAHARMCSQVSIFVRNAVVDVTIVLLSSWRRWLPVAVVLFVVEQDITPYGIMAFGEFASRALTPILAQANLGARAR